MNKKRLSPLAITTLGVGIVVLGAGVIFQDHIRHQVLLATIAAGSSDNAQTMFLDTSSSKQIEFDPNACVCPSCCKLPTSL